ncbi:hypothetical protein A2U01_0095599, partial [Trifolium medium]|nr:hypothetical protein [Trifolium medium]
VISKYSSAGSRHGCNRLVGVHFHPPDHRCAPKHQPSCVSADSWSAIDGQLLQNCSITSPR